MMSLTAERRKALRLEAERHRQEQLKKMGIKDTLNPAFAPSSDNMDKKPEQTEEIKQPETPAEVVPTSETVATSLFPELETEKPKEEVMDLSPRPFNGLLEPHYRDGSMVLDASRNLDAICSKVMCKAGIRQGKNERKSLHLFRHNVATTLLQGGVQQPVISATLGHASPDSLDRYLSAEFKRLKECSLSIEHFPIRKGVFDV